MKITAVGANRQVYTHTVMNRAINKISAEDGKVIVKSISSEDPGISSGQYRLTFELEKEEVLKLYEVARNMETNQRIDDLEEEIEDLKNQLRGLQ